MSPFSIYPYESSFSTFKSKEKGAKSAAKYATTALLHYALSYVLCAIVFYFAAKIGIVGFGRTILKLMVDGLLYVVTYKVQQMWVFKKS